MAGAKSGKAVEIISQKIDYTSPPMDVIRFEILDAKGKKRPYWMLDRKNDFSVIIPLFPDNSTVLVGQYRLPIKIYSWEFAMGTVANKSPKDTAEQELREETGIICRNLHKIGEFYLAPGISSQVGHVFVAKGLTQGVSEPEEDEDLETKKLPIEKVRDLIRSGEIKDGPTIIAMHLLETKLNI